MFETLEYKFRRYFSDTNNSIACWYPVTRCKRSGMRMVDTVWFYNFHGTPDTAFRHGLKTALGAAIGTPSLCLRSFRFMAISYKAYFKYGWKLYDVSSALVKNYSCCTSIETLTVHTIWKTATLCKLSAMRVLSNLCFQILFNFGPLRSRTWLWTICLAFSSVYVAWKHLLRAGSLMALSQTIHP